MHANPCTPATTPAAPQHVLTADMWHVLLAIRERASSTGATTAQRVDAYKAAMAERRAGRSQAVAVAQALKHLPSLRGLRVAVTQ